MTYEGTRATTVVLLLSIVLQGPFSVGAAQSEATRPRIVSREVTAKRPPLYLATYADRSGFRLISPGRVSGNNGKNWKAFSPTPDFNSGLPYGFRRDTSLAMQDPVARRYLMVVNALDTPGLDPKAVEPPIAAKEYYLRYRVSKDGGRTWIFDAPIVQVGAAFSEQHPFPEIYRGKNGIFFGDCGGTPIRSQSGRILVPVHMTVADEKGELFNPHNQRTFTEVLVLIGSWRPDSRIDWHASARVSVDSSRSTRGLIEPTLAQLPDGRLLLVMRGSNAGQSDLPSYRWFSISSDDGETWSEPNPWGYEDRRPFFSPSSMSVLIRYSSGRVFWIGNICGSNCKGNGPRWPVVLGEVDPQTLMLLRDSVLELDTKSPQDEARGRELLEKFNGDVDLSHFWVFEDRQSGELVVTYPRTFEGKKSDWAVVRVAISDRAGKASTAALSGTTSRHPFSFLYTAPFPKWTSRDSRS